MTAPADALGRLMSPEVAVAEAAICGKGWALWLGVRAGSVGEAARPAHRPCTISCDVITRHVLIRERETNSW